MFYVLITNFAPVSQKTFFLQKKLGKFLNWIVKLHCNPLKNVTKVSLYQFCARYFVMLKTCYKNPSFTLSTWKRHGKTGSDSFVIFAFETKRLKNFYEKFYSKSPWPINVWFKNRNETIWRQAPKRQSFSQNYKGFTSSYHKRTWVFHHLIYLPAQHSIIM